MKKIVMGYMRGQDVDLSMKKFVSLHQNGVCPLLKLNNDLRSMDVYE